MSPWKTYIIPSSLLPLNLSLDRSLSFDDTILEARSCLRSSHICNTAAPMSKTHLSEKVKPTDMIPSTPRSPCLRSYTPPDSPRLTPSSQVVTVELLGQVLVKLIQAAQKADTIDRSEDAKPGAAENTEIGESKTRASKMEYKTVNEMYGLASPTSNDTSKLTCDFSWDKETHSHKIEEAAATTDVHELDRYVFVLRKQFGKHAAMSLDYPTLTALKINRILIGNPSLTSSQSLLGMF